MEEETNTQNNEDEEEFKEEKKSKKSIPWVTIIIILLIVAVAFFIIKYPKSQPNLDCDTMCCVGNNSILVASKGCGACHRQIELLGDNKDDFNIIYCDENTQFCVDNQIMAVPTWIINEEKFVGVRSIDELKELTSC